MKRELSDRLLAFSIRVIKFLRRFDNTPEIKIIKYQLIKSSSSAGANYEEAQGASSKADFINKAKIALKEMRESNYWLKVIKGINEHPHLANDLNELFSESEELKKILGAICVTASRNRLE
jgi:four helix bundle protein